MFRKTIVRVTLAGLLLVAGTLMVMAAWAPRIDKSASNCEASKVVKEQCESQIKEQGEFLIWETLNRALNIAIH
ncbi:MAG: hypothetical protein J7578_20575 [Chitinophagaceae bacterium]|nr:hypothetical protein [Chitinophagaceae bacterium]